MSFNAQPQRAMTCAKRIPLAVCARGFTLIELLVYMTMLFLVLGLAYTAMYRSMDASTALRRNANDISQTLKIGELWRDDVRSAIRPIRLENSGPGIVLHIPQRQTEIDYCFSTNIVSRRVGHGDWSAVLDRVKDCIFIDDQREKVKAWRWELELQPSRKRITRVRPLFTFLAVPSSTSAQ